MSLLASTPSFTAPKVGQDTSFVFRVTVTDGTASASSDVTVVVKHVNHDPLARAGQDQQVKSGTTVQLDASGSSDADSDSLVYAWSQTGGPAVQLSSASTARPTFTAPSVTKTTVLSFEVSVNDGHGGTALSRMFVQVDAAASGGCSTGGAGSLAPLGLLFGLLALRRRRTSKQ